MCSEGGQRADNQLAIAGAVVTVAGDVLAADDYPSLDGWRPISTEAAWVLRVLANDPEADEGLPHLEPSGALVNAAPKATSLRSDRQDSARELHQLLASFPTVV
jgi:hypothetical protein